MGDSSPVASHESVAVAVNRGSKSLRAFAWALHKLVSPGQTITLIHIRTPIRAVPCPMGNYIPIAHVSNEVVDAYRKYVEIETEKMLSQYRELCESKQVQLESMVFEEFNVPEAIVKSILVFGVSKLVMGSPSRSSFPRRIKSSDVPASVVKFAPAYCILYLVSKNKYLCVTPDASTPESRRIIQVGASGITSFLNISDSISNRSPRRDDSEYSMFQSCKFDMCESPTSDKRHSPTTPTGAKSFRTASEFEFKILSITNDGSQAQSMVDPDARVYSDNETGLEGFAVISKVPSMTEHSPTKPTGTSSFRTASEFKFKRNLSIANGGSQAQSTLDPDARVYSDIETRLEGSAEISKVPSMTDVPNPGNNRFIPKHEVISDDYEIISKDQSSLDFQPDKQNSRSMSFDIKIEAITISTKGQTIGDPSETGNARISLSPRVFEGNGLHSLAIQNSEGSGFPEENMELQASPTGNCRLPLAAESSEKRPLDRAILNIEQNALKLGEDLDEQSAQVKTGLGPSSSGIIKRQLEDLKHELARIRADYSAAFEEAVAAKKKAQELHLQRVEDSKQLETAKERVELAIAIAAEEMARREAAVREAEAAKQIADIEAKLRKKVELMAKRNSRDIEKAKKLALETKDERYRKYSVEEIDKATSFLSESMKIGEGGYGSVYKAVLDHITVAIKVLHQDAIKGWIQFQQEVAVLCRIRHPHIVLLLGASPESGYLVYEYMANGSLEDRLLRKGATPPLPCFQRFRIAWEVASGLFFLHSCKPEPFVHRDLKPANILLDQNMVSKIGDVGLARLVPPTVSCSIKATSIAGTVCYIDPEYQRTGKLGTKSDLYSFGILLLQLLTAKPPDGITYIVQIAIEKGTFSKILDPSVKDWPVQEAMNLAKLALKCSELRRKDRPDLGTVVLPELQRLKDVAQAHFEAHLGAKVMYNSPPPTTQSMLVLGRPLFKKFVCS